MHEQIGRHADLSHKIAAASGRFEDLIFVYPVILLTDINQNSYICMDTVYLFVSQSLPSYIP